MSGGGINRNVTVSQEAAPPPVELTVSPSNRDVPYTAGSTIFSVTSNTSWTVTDDADWLTVSPSSGSNNGTLTATYQANNTIIQRVAHITVSGGGITIIVTVTQAPMGITLIVDPSNQDVPNTAGSTTFSVTSNTSWTVTDDADWLTVSPSSGSNNGTLTATYQANNTIIQRVAHITVSGGGITIIVTVTQASIGPYITISVTGLTNFGNIELVKYL